MQTSLKFVLQHLQGGGLMVAAVQAGIANNNYTGVLKMLGDQYRDNPTAFTTLFGTVILNMLQDEPEFCKNSTTNNYKRSGA